MMNPPEIGQLLQLKALNLSSSLTTLPPQTGQTVVSQSVDSAHSFRVCYSNRATQRGPPTPKILLPFTETVTQSTIRVDSTIST
jgi:hypothetical protein